MAIRIFATGGTFDKEYNDIDGQLFFRKTHLPEILTAGRSRVNVKITTILMLDSLDMTEKDRQTIARSCNAAKEERIVITHGTDTMAKTAKVLARKVKNKTIILTGAMVPYVFRSSDGLFNLGSALAFAQSMPHGVYVAMNGNCFDWHNVRKNLKTRSFEKVR